MTNNDSTPQKQQKKSVPHLQYTKDVCVNEFNAGFLTAKGFLFNYLACTKKAGWEHPMNLVYFDLCKEDGAKAIGLKKVLPESVYHEARRTLIKEGFIAYNKEKKTFAVKGDCKIFKPAIEQNKEQNSAKKVDKNVEKLQKSAENLDNSGEKLQKNGEKLQNSIVEKPKKLANKGSQETPRSINSEQIVQNNHSYQKLTLLGEEGNGRELTPPPINTATNAPLPSQEAEEEEEMIDADLSRATSDDDPNHPIQIEFVIKWLKEIHYKKKQENVFPSLIEKIKSHPEASITVYNRMKHVDADSPARYFSEALNKEISLNPETKAESLKYGINDIPRVMDLNSDVRRKFLRKIYHYEISRYVGEWVWIEYDSKLTRSFGNYKQLESLCDQQKLFIPTTGLIEDDSPIPLLYIHDSRIIKDPEKWIKENTRLLTPEDRYSDKDWFLYDSESNEYSEGVAGWKFLYRTFMYYGKSIQNGTIQIYIKDKPNPNPTPN